MSPLISDLSTFDMPPRREREPAPKRPRRWRAVLSAFVVYLLLRFFFFDGVRVASSSMAPTLMVGDRVLASSHVYGMTVPLIGLRLPGLSSPKVDDVVLFRHPERPREVFIKRCAGVAGDSVTVAGEPAIVPFDMIYVLGDNRGASWDSRDWGFLPVDQILGRAEFVFWSRGSDGIRWGRSGRGMRRRTADD